MNNYLDNNSSYALYPIIYLVLGIIISWAWAWHFRRLANNKTSQHDLVMESRMGLLGSVIWLVAIGSIFLLMYTQNSISIAEIMAASESFSQPLIDNCQAWLDSLQTPALIMFGLAVSNLLLVGIWSGSLRNLSKKEQAHV
ncbi:MAG: hypothetical protein GY780_11240 [bacterium]|nr:hypothetical protein [bacterium]